MLVGLAAQDESNAIALQVLGPAGLIATAKPWFRPRWEATAMQLVWPNGARAYVRTPEVPGKIRGLEYHLSWICEIQSWPPATRDEAYSNFVLSSRVGYGRICWDATPKKRHPILRKLLAQSASDPRKHVIVRGATRENVANLGVGYVEDLQAEYAGTSRGREELEGEMLEESEGALVRQAWIDAARRPAPDAIKRRAIGIDPAVTNRAGNDRTGIVDAALALDDQLLVLGDYSGRHSADAWAGIVLDRYVQGACDCVVVETNKGGDLVTQNLRAHAGRRGLSVVVLGRDEPARVTHGVVYVREVHARGAKEDRAQPLATAYERGRVSHVIGADLADLEDTITTWEPTPGIRSPDSLDALVHVGTELLGLLSNFGDPKAVFAGALALANASAARAPAANAASNLARLLSGGLGPAGGGRI